MQVVELVGQVQVAAEQEVPVGQVEVPIQALVLAVVRVPEKALAAVQV